MVLFWSRRFRELQSNGAWRAFSNDPYFTFSQSPSVLVRDECTAASRRFNNKERKKKEIKCANQNITAPAAATGRPPVWETLSAHSRTSRSSRQSFERRLRRRRPRFQAGRGERGVRGTEKTYTGRYLSSTNHSAGQTETERSVGLMGLTWEFAGWLMCGAVSAEWPYTDDGCHSVAQADVYVN